VRLREGRVPGIDPGGLDRADVAWFRGERRDRSRTPVVVSGSRGFPPRVDAPSQGCPHEKKSFVHPFTRLAPRRLVKGRLGSNLARPPAARSFDRTPSTQRCFGPTSATHISKTSTRVTCDNRLAGRGEPPLADGFRVSRRSTHFGQLTRRWHRAFSSRRGRTRAEPLVPRRHPLRHGALRRCTEPDDLDRFHRPP
jgi:hypothetical protein